jgi:hypothetical protein
LRKIICTLFLSFPRSLPLQTQEAGRSYQLYAEWKMMSIHHQPIRPFGKNASTGIFTKCLQAYEKRVRQGLFPGFM